MQNGNTNPLVSIVIPVYNGEKYINQCYRLIQEQTYKNLDVIFVNDGSVDDSKNICDEIVKNDSRIRVIHKENGGTARARNAGIDIANGKYITFLDVDDEYTPNLVQTMVSLMESSCVDIGVCGFYYKTEQPGKNGNKTTTYLEKKIYPAVKYSSQDELKKDLVKLWDSNILFNVWNKFYRMDLINEKHLRFTDGHVHSEDVDFNRKLIENCNSLEIIEDALYYYIVERSGSTTEKFWDNYFEIRDKDFHLVISHFKRLGIWDETSKEYACRYFIERISGVIENLFHAGKQLDIKEKLMRAKEIICHNDVVYASKYAKIKSTKMKILIFPIKHCIIWLAMFEHWCIYIIRTMNPALFYKMKNRR